MKKIIILFCLAFISSSAFSQDVEFLPNVYCDTITGEPVNVKYMNGLLCDCVKLLPNGEISEDPDCLNVGVCEQEETECKLLGIPGFDRVTGGIATYPADMYNDVSILVRSGTVNVIIGGGTPIPINAGEFKVWPHPIECEYWTMEFIFDGSGGAVFDVLTIR